MTRLKGFENCHDTPERVINYVYNICFRLYGNHTKTGKLVKAVLVNSGSPEDPVALIKALCTIYLNLSRVESSEVVGYPPGLSVHQQALLQLAPLERLVVILRDVAGFNYDEIAGITGCVRSDVTRLLASGRWNFKDKLISSHPVDNSKTGGIKVNVG